MGGGVGLSIHAPIRIATDNSMYAMPETAIGFFTDVGGSYSLSRLKNNISLGLYLGITGYRLKAKDLVKWGIATHFVSQDKISQLYSDLGSKVNQNSTDAEIRQIVEAHADQDAAKAKVEQEEVISAIFKNDSIQDIFHRLEANTIDPEFCAKTLKTCKGMSPLSMAIVFE